MSTCSTARRGHLAGEISETNERSFSFSAKSSVSVTASNVTMILVFYSHVTVIWTIRISIIVGATQCSTVVYSQFNNFNLFKYHTAFLSVDIKKTQKKHNI